MDNLVLSTIMNKSDVETSVRMMKAYPPLFKEAKALGIIESIPSKSIETYLFKLKYTYKKYDVLDIERCLRFIKNIFKKNKATDNCQIDIIGYHYSYYDSFNINDNIERYYPIRIKTSCVKSAHDLLAYSETTKFRRVFSHMIFNIKTTNQSEWFNKIYNLEKYPEINPRIITLKLGPKSFRIHHQLMCDNIINITSLSCQ